MRDGTIPGRTNDPRVLGERRREVVLITRPPLACASLQFGVFQANLQLPRFDIDSNPVAVLKDAAMALCGAGSIRELTPDLLAST